MADLADLEDLAHRVARLEAEATATAERVSDARRLASGADREVAGLGIKVRVISTLIQALHKTQSETTRRLGSLEREVRSGFAMMAAGFEAIHDRLDRLTGES